MEESLLPSLQFLDWKFYLYIGITSLCLYSSTVIFLLQDGILYKVHRFISCKSQIMCTLTILSLTFLLRCDMLMMLGRKKEQAKLALFYVSCL